MHKFILLFLLAPCLLFAKETKTKAVREKINPDQEQTLVLIKPEAVANSHIGDIVSQFERDGLRIAGIKMVQLSQKDAEEFYAVHQNRPFYGELTKYVSSGPIVAIVLEGKNAVNKNRKLMGDTDPSKADKNTIRGKWGTDIQQNAVHGSDSIINARREIGIFFTKDEILNSKAN